MRRWNGRWLACATVVVGPVEDQEPPVKGDAVREATCRVVPKRMSDSASLPLD